MHVLLNVTIKSNIVSTITVLTTSLLAQITVIFVIQATFFALIRQSIRFNLV